MGQDSFFLPAKRSRRERNAPKKQSHATSDDRDMDEDDHQLDAFDMDDIDLEHHHDHSSESSNESDLETAQEKRIRLARKYIDDIQTAAAETSGDVDAAEIDRALIAERLRDDALEEKGRLFRRMAHLFQNMDVENVHMTSMKGHQLSVTCVAIAPNESFCFSGSKDGSIIKWCTITGKRLFTIKAAKKGAKDSQGHMKEVNALAVSSDNRYLVSGGKEKYIYVWRTEDGSLVREFKHHRDSITALVFRKGSNTFYSASLDRSIKVFSLDEMTYVETLFGHQDAITCLDNVGSRERCVSTGGRDRSVRMWKIVEESQLVFRFSASNKGKVSEADGILTAEDALMRDDSGSVDCCAVLDDDTWVTGTDGGVLSMWSAQRKKPLFSLPNAHGRTLSISDSEMNTETVLLDREFADDIGDIDENIITHQPNWIISMSTIQNSDLLATGSSDGYIRFWRILKQTKGGRRAAVFDEDDDEEQGGRVGFKPVAKYPMPGFVNALQFSSSGKFLVVGLGQEHRSGRWQRMKEARNGVRILNLDAILSPPSASEAIQQQQQQL